MITFMPVVGKLLPQWWHLIGFYKVLAAFSAVRNSAKIFIYVESLNLLIIANFSK